MDSHAELLQIAETIETNGGWHIAAIKVRAAADRIRVLEDALHEIADSDSFSMTALRNHAKYALASTETHE